MATPCCYEHEIKRDGEQCPNGKRARSTATAAGHGRRGRGAPCLVQHPRKGGRTFSVTASGSVGSGGGVGSEGVGAGVMGTGRVGLQQQCSTACTTLPHGHLGPTARLERSASLLPAAGACRILAVELWRKGAAAGKACRVCVSQRSQGALSARLAH